MGDSIVFEESKYSIEDLEKFRDRDGFIDLDKAKISFSQESKEVVGNPNRIKNWVNFNGKCALIKGETVLDKNSNYGIYGELISEEIAKKMGIETAHYDLVKITGENGRVIYGVLSESVIDFKSDERLESLHSIIGDEDENTNSMLIDITDYEFTVKRLRDELLLDGVDEEQVEHLIEEYNKRLAFGIAILDTDKHTENIAFIRTKENGKEKIRLSPNYDSESALMLDTDTDVVEKLLGDIQALQESTSFADPRIGTLISEEDGGFESLWMDTLTLLCDSDEGFDFYLDVLKNPIDMDEIFETIEARIGAELPKEVKLLAKYSYKFRNEEMQRVIEGELLEKKDSTSFDINALLQSLISQGITEEIRTGEQIDTGNKMKDDIAREEDQEIDDSSKKSDVPGNKTNSSDEGPGNR